MTLSEKLDNSVIISIKEVKNSAYGIKPTQKRIKKYIFFFLIAAFTIATKFIFKKITDWDVSYLFLAINLIALCVLTVLDGHQRKYNHLVLYKATYFVSKLCKTVIFIFSFFVAYQFFDVYYKEMVGKNFWEFYQTTFFKGDFEAYFEAHGLSHIGQYIEVDGVRMQYSDVLIKLAVLYVSFITAVPAFLFLFLTDLELIGKLIKLLIILVIPFYNIYYFVRWFISTNVTFLHYVPKEGTDDMTIIERREIVKGRTAIRLKQIFAHFLITASAIGIIWYMQFSFKNLFRF